MECVYLPFALNGGGTFPYKPHAFYRTQKYFSIVELYSIKVSQIYGKVQLKKLFSKILKIHEKSTFSFSFCARATKFDQNAAKIVFYGL